MFTPRIPHLHLIAPAHFREVGVVRDAIMAVVENELGVSLDPVVGCALKAAENMRRGWLGHLWPPGLPWCW